MSPKIGQKITDNPKDTRIQIRMDKETIEKLNCLAAEQNSDRSKVIRQGIEIQYEKMDGKKSKGKGDFDMQIKIKFPDGNRPEDIQLSWTKESNGAISKVKWKGKFSDQRLLSVEKKDDCLILKINETYAEK